VSGTPDQISDGEAPFPRLHVTSPPQPSAHAAAPSPADSDDEAPIPRFSHRTALVSCYGDAEVPLPHPGRSCRSSSPSPPIARPQPALQAMPSRVVTSDLLLLLLLLHAGPSLTPTSSTVRPTTAPSAPPATLLTTLPANSACEYNFKPS
jgi:hypothetical protein